MKRLYIKQIGIVPYGGKKIGNKNANEMEKYVKEKRGLAVSNMVMQIPQHSALMSKIKSKTKTLSNTGFQLT